MTQTATAAPTNLIFWDPTGYKFNSATDWNQWRYVADGLGGKIGIRFSVSPGFATWNWDSHGGKAPAASIGDVTGAASFGKNQQTGLSTTSVNAIRMQTNQQFVGAQNNFTIELDFSQYKGSKAGGKDGVAGANTFVGVSDIYAGQTYAKTVVTITGTLEGGSAASPAGWTLVNGGAVQASAGGNQPSAQLSLVNGVLQGTSTPAPGGQPNSIDTVMGLVRLDAAGYKTLHLRYDLYPVGNSGPRTDLSALYVATAIPSKPVEPPAPVIEPPAPPVTDEQCKVKSVVNTSALFSAALERLNRRSVVQLLEQVIAEVNAHCEKQVGPTINITELTQQIEALNVKLTLIKNTLNELEGKDRGQLEELLKKLLVNIDLGKVIQNIQINVDGRSFQLESLLQVISTVDQVVNIQIQYPEVDLGDISGAIFILQDNSKVVFNVRTVQQANPDRVIYIFETASWKGVPAQFSMIFSRRTRTYKLCNHSVNFDSFDAVEQSNIVFDLCTKIVKVTK